MVLRVVFAAFSYVRLLLFLCRHLFALRNAQNRTLEILGFSPLRPCSLVFATYRVSLRLSQPLGAFAWHIAPANPARFAGSTCRRLFQVFSSQCMAS